MLENILNNLQIIGLIFLIFTMVYSANILFSLGQNILKMKENFDKSKFLYGVLKMFIIGIGCGLLSVSFTMITYFIDTATNLIVEIPEDLLSICNNSVIIAIFFNSIKKYASECWETLKDLLDNLKTNNGF